MSSGPHFYEIIYLGRHDARLSEIENTLHVRLDELGVSASSVKVFDESNANERDRKLPSIAIFLGYDGAEDSSHPFLPELLDDSTTIITLVSALSRVSSEIPSSLRHINALATDHPTAIDRVVSTVLEHFRLLRAERKLFISYKRSDTEGIANTIYDELDRRGFDVFIDTRSVPPAKDFQKELWHRLADADVIVLLDSPGFRGSRWTTAELAQANATNVQILHVLWPGEIDDGSSALSVFYQMAGDDFLEEQTGKDAKLTPIALLGICDEVERLRARAIAARYRYLVDSFCDAARDLGLHPTVHPDRWVSVERKNGVLGVIPTIGVPTSDRIHRTFSQLSSQAMSEMWLVYDNRGLVDTWLEHLDWLDEHLPIRSMRMASAYGLLSEAT